MRTPARLVGLVALSLVPGYGHAQGYLENPQPNSAQSGISVVSGWHCAANVIEFQIDDRRLVPVPYGSERKDTESVCGDWDNGFVLLLNYSGMGDGTHTITVYADGVAFGSATFLVATLGDPFVRGLERSIVIPDFPELGFWAILLWDEAKQSFTIAKITREEPTDEDIANVRPALSDLSVEQLLDGVEDMVNSSVLIARLRSPI